LDFPDLKFVCLSEFVSDFDIRISDLFSGSKRIELLERFEPNSPRGSTLRPHSVVDFALSNPGYEAAFIGKLTVNVEPLPSALQTETRPPSISVNDLTM
jgi:hypothetical protein